MSDIKNINNKRHIHIDESGHLKINVTLIKRMLFRYSLSFIVINLSSALAVLVDGVVVSRFIGSTAMAAVGLSSPTFAILSLFSSVFSVGTQSLCASALSCANKEEHQKIFNNSMAVSWGVIAIVTLACFIFVNPLCILYGAGPDNPEMHYMLKQYLLGNFVGIPGYMGCTLLAPLVVLDNNKKTLTFASLIQNVLNVFGDVVAVAVLGAGIGGVGFVTGLTNNIAVVILLLNFLRKKSIFKFKVQKPEFKYIGKILAVGSSRIIRYLCKICSKLFLNRIILFFGGSIAMTAMSVNQSMNGVVLAVGLGIGECVKTFTQVLYSEKDEKNLKILVRNSIYLMLIMTLPITACVIIFARQIGLVFAPSDADAIEEIILAVTCLGISLPFNGINCIIVDYFQGAKKIFMTSVMSFLHRLLCIVVTSLVLGYFLGFAGVFIALPVSEILVTIVYLVMMFIKNRKTKGIRRKLLDIPENFQLDFLGSYSIGVYSVEEVMTVSRNIGDFLKQYDECSPKVIYIVSLCLEEMAGNIVKHGFNLDWRPHSCEIRVMVETDHSICIRIRDDCKLFDIREKYVTSLNDDAFSNIGLRCVYGMAREVTYISMLKTNNVIIRV